MAKKKRKPRQSLHHAAVEREMRRLNEQGAVVERQRDLIRTVLNALVFKLGGTAKLTKEDFDRSGGGTIAVDERKGGGLVVTFTPREGVKPPSFWRRLWENVRRWFPRSTPEPEPEPVDAE